MAFVLDASMTMAWCFKDERTDESDAVLRALAEDQAIVPPAWSFEIGNAALRGLRRNRLTASEVVSFLRTLEQAPIRQSEPMTPEAILQLLSVARTYGLSAYDAAYLEMALYLGLPLATLDAPLRQAAEQAGVSLFVPSSPSNDG